MDLKIYWEEEAVGKYFNESYWIVIVMLIIYLFFTRAAVIIWKIHIEIFFPVLREWGQIWH